MRKERPGWQRFQKWLRDYSEKSVTDRLSWFNNREGWYVLFRMVLLAICSFVVFFWSITAVNFAIAALALYLLFDAIAVATAHAFIPDPLREPDSIVRFVFLNFLSYLSLMFWLTIFLSLVPSHFDPTLNLADALEVAFAVITASAAADPADAKGPYAWMVVGLGNVLALYWLLVILVTGVSRVEYQKKPESSVTAESVEAEGRDG